jgi:single-strand DNA-binding protein
MAESVIRITGNLVRNPELRFTASGLPVCSFTVAVTPQEKNGDAWKDCETQYWTVSAWRALAEHVAESFERGDPATVSGRVNFRTWETKEGEKRLQHEINADSVSVPLNYHTVVIKKAERTKPATVASAQGGSNGA